MTQTVKQLVDSLTYVLKQYQALDQNATIDIPTANVEVTDRGFSEPNDLGLVQITGLEKLRARLIEEGYPQLAAAIPLWHLTDWWNPQNGDALETLNSVNIGAKAKTLLNYNLNRFWLFGNDPNPKVPSFKPPSNGYIAQAWGNGWNQLPQNLVPVSPVTNVRELVGDTKTPWVADWNAPPVPNAYLWQKEISTKDSSYHVEFWTKWAEANTGKKFS